MSIVHVLTSKPGLRKSLVTCSYVPSSSCKFSWSCFSLLSQAGRATGSAGPSPASKHPQFAWTFQHDQARAIQVRREEQTLRLGLKLRRFVPVVRLQTPRIYERETNDPNSVFANLRQGAAVSSVRSNWTTSRAHFVSLDTHFPCFTCCVRNIGF